MNFFYKILFLFSNCESKHLLPYNYVGFEKVKFQVLQISRQDVLNYPDKIARMFFSYHWDEGFVWSQSKAVEECLASSRDGLTEKKRIWITELEEKIFYYHRLFQLTKLSTPSFRILRDSILHCSLPLSLYLHYFWVTLVKRGSRITTPWKN